MYIIWTLYGPASKPTDTLDTIVMHEQNGYRLTMSDDYIRLPLKQHCIWHQLPKGYNT